MGQAFDREGRVLGEAFGDTKRDVFEKLNNLHADAHEIRIRSLSDRMAAEEQHIQQAAASAEMPRYKCHKVVHALKIQEVALDSAKAQTEGRETDGSAMLTPSDVGYARFKVDSAYVRKHNPQAGGYYVVYEDGYKSFSPADAFESGYTRL